jgi:hypothetical protein
MNSRTYHRAPVRAARALWVAWVLLGALVAHADGFSVGRVDVSFAEPGWELMVLPDRTQAYGGQKDGKLSVQSALFFRRSAGSDVGALVLVSANSSGMGGGRAGHMQYTVDCQPNDHYHREGNQGIRRSFVQCLTVMPRYRADSVFEQLAPQLLEIDPASETDADAEAKAELLALPVYTVWSHHAISTGSFVDVRVFVWSRIGADGAAVSEQLPAGVPPEHVAWGRQLKDAVKSSVYSLSGRLVMPPLPMALPDAPSVEAVKPAAG